MDRFGVMPVQTKNLILFHELRIHLISTDVIKIDSSQTITEITFKNNADIDPIQIIDLLQNDRRFKMNGPDRIKITASINDTSDRVAFIIKTLNQLKSN